MTKLKLAGALLATSMLASAAWAEDVTLTIDATYLFGEPVGNATVSIKQYRLEHVYAWYGYDEESCISNR